MVKISIIVPAYNIENYIERTFESILSQSFTDFEVIVVDDGSVDNTEEIIKNYGKKDDRIKYIYQDNAGAGAARNTGIRASAGKYLVFVDSDDYIDKEMLSKLYNSIEKQKADIIVCDYFTDTNCQISTTQGNPRVSNNNVKNYLLSYFAPWGKIIKGDLIRKNNLLFFESRLYEDLATIPSFVNFTDKIDFLEEPLYYYYQRENSMMNQPKYSEKLKDVFSALDHLKDTFENNTQMKTYYSEIEYIYITHLLHDASLRFLPFDESLNDLKKINEIMKNTFPNWKQNKYYKKKNFKYRVVCSLIYNEKYAWLKKILKSHSV